MPRGRKPQCVKRKKEVEQILVPQLTLCYRCSEPISYLQKETRYCLDADGNVIAKHVYYYAVHYGGYTKQGGKVQLNYHRCYLGSDEYDYVERFNRLSLAGAIKEDRYKDYLKRIIDYVDEDMLKKMQEQIQQQLKKLEEQKQKDKLDLLIKKLNEFAS